MWKRGELGGGAKYETGTLSSYNHTTNKSFSVSFEPDIILIMQDRQVNDYFISYYKGGVHGFPEYSCTCAPVTGIYTILGSTFGYYISVSGTTVTLNGNVGNWDGVSFKWIAIKF